MIDYDYTQHSLLQYSVFVIILSYIFQVRKYINLN